MIGQAVDVNAKPHSFERSATDRVITGTAAGIGRRLGVDPLFVRLAFGLLALNFGVGLLLYAILFKLSGPTGEQTSSPSRPVTSRHILGFCLLTLGVLVALRSTGIWLADQVMWPLTFVAMGSTVIFVRSDDDAHRWETNPFTGVLGARPSRLRLAAGTLLVAIGVAAFLFANNAIFVGGPALLAMTATAGGVALILGPWLSRLGRQLMDERRQLIRTEERAEVGAHLHDSVLQTLTMIQRAVDPEEMALLARQQERELRAWLHGQNAGDDANLAAAVDAIAAKIEKDHGVRVETVVVGDHPLDEPTRALLAATQEASVNAARHSTAAKVSVFVEVEASSLTAFVRDDGSGFDITAIADDRRGIRESIEGRMRRHGGTATVQSEPGKGTEVELRLPIHPQS